MARPAGPSQAEPSRRIKKNPAKPCRDHLAQAGPNWAGLSRPSQTGSRLEPGWAEPGRMAWAGWADPDCASLIDTLLIFIDPLLILY